VDTGVVSWVSTIYGETKYKRSRSLDRTFNLGRTGVALGRTHSTRLPCNDDGHSDAWTMQHLLLSVSRSVPMRSQSEYPENSSKASNYI
jgi:hypothetical protein